MFVLNPEMGGQPFIPKAVSADWVELKKCALVQFIGIDEERKIGHRYMS